MSWQSYLLTFRNSLTDETKVIEQVIPTKVRNDMSRKNNSTAVVETRDIKGESKHLRKSTKEAHEGTQV
jgi:hypothetical protein